MAYLTKDQFAQKQGYDDWDAYVLKNKDYVTEDALDDMIEEMESLMNDEIGTLDTNVTTAKYLKVLRNICYRGVQMMVDEEQARAHEGQRSIFTPQDYMPGRTRERLRSMGKRLKFRKRGKWVF